MVGDIMSDSLKIRRGDGKGPIAGLPRKAPKHWSLGFDPFRRGLFDVLDRLTDRNGAGEIEKKVNVVFDGIDEDGSAAQILKHGGHVSVKRLANGIGDEWLAVLGAKDEMDV